MGEKYRILDSVAVGAPLLEPAKGPQNMEKDKQSKPIMSSSCRVFQLPLK